MLAKVKNAIGMIGIFSISVASASHHICIQCCQFIMISFQFGGVFYRTKPGEGVYIEGCTFLYVANQY